MPANSEARAVFAEPGPISKIVQAEMMLTAVSLLTPRFTRIGKILATSNSHKPAALGVQTKSIWPMGNISMAAISGKRLKSISGRILTYTSASEAWICFI